MKKKSAAYLLLLTFSCLLLSSVPSFAGNSWIRNDSTVHNIVWKGKLEKRIAFLTDTLCEGRRTGTRGGVEAAFWTEARFRDAGLLPFGDCFSRSFVMADSLHGRQGIGRNIIGMMPGSRKMPKDSYIIVGAHYDHLGILEGRMYPGADANAAGVAALVNLAEMFRSMQITGRSFGENVIFVAFDAKERDMAGSEAFWKLIEDGALADPLTGRPVTADKIHLMANLDQIGSSLAPLASGRKDYLIALGNDMLPSRDRMMLSMCNRFYGTDLELSESYYGSKNFTKIFYRLSDQKPFVDHGIPSVFFTSGITMNTYKTYDRPEHLDLDVLRSRIILIWHWLDKLLR